MTTLSMSASELDSLLEELKQYKRDKNHLMEFYIEERLNKSLEVYYKELTDSIQYLARRDELNVLKKMGKE